MTRASPIHKPRLLQAMACLLALGTALPAIAWAQTAPAAPAPTAAPSASAPGTSTPVPRRSDYYDQDGQSYGSLYFKKRASTLGIALIGMEGLDPGQFVLRLTAGDGVSGCARISNPAYEVTFQDIYMDVKVDEYVVDMRHQTGASHYACNQTYQLPTVQIPLSRDDLRNRKIQRIRFNNGPYIDYYDVYLDDHRVQLLPAESEIPGKARYRPQKINNVRNPLLHWFYPEGTVILYVPDASSSDKDVRASLDAMAASKGLEPLEKWIPEFQPPVLKAGYYYYVDKKGKMLRQSGLSDGVQIGTISVSRTYYGLRGDEAMNQDMQVIAKTPGMYE